jgi:hypothetical protein
LRLTDRSTAGRSAAFRANGAADQLNNRSFSLHMPNP